MLNILVGIAVTLALPAAEPLSGELAHLVTLTGDKDALIDAARRFDRQQIDLIEWDRKLARQYEQSEQDDLVEAKMEDSRHRVQLVREAWRYVLSHYPNNARANNYYGELLYDHLRDVDGGFQQWLLATRLDEDLALPHNNLALHYFHHGQYNKGLRHLGKALDLEPKNPDFLYNGAQIYLNYFPQLEAKFDINRKKLYKQAMEMSRDAAKYAPDDFVILQDYATNFYAAENFDVDPDWEDAANAWRTARVHARTDVERFHTYLNEARTWTRAKKDQQAIPALEKALALQPDSDVVRRLLEEARAKN